MKGGYVHLGFGSEKTDLIYEGITTLFGAGYNPCTTEKTDLIYEGITTAFLASFLSNLTWRKN